MNIRPQDLVSHEPTLWFRRHQLFGLGAPSFLGQKLPQSLWISVVEITVAALNLRVSGVAILSVEFPIHASSSICICLVWRICMTPGTFLMCAASASEGVLAEPFWKAHDLRKGVLAQNTDYSGSRQTLQLSATHWCIQTSIVAALWQIPLKSLHPRNLLNPESQIPRYKFKLNQNLNLNLYRKMARTLSFSIWLTSGGWHLQ